MTKLSVAIMVLLAISFLRDSPAAAKGNHERNGDYLEIVLPGLGLATCTVIADWDGCLMWIKSTAATALTTQALKHTIKAKRPYGDTRYDSFPSGHTSAAFSGAAFLQMRYGWWAGVPAYAAASYTGWSRVNANKHYWHDVIAGAAIGIGFNWWLTDRYPGRTVQASYNGNEIRLALL
ncbi:MAG: phosphatase PAP2 family protein, partial [Alphaproteobacteria bacterium]|nr:phosphatase PAP2 family protein [Alphaproteobacteria bacterium]